MAGTGSGAGGDPARVDAWLESHAVALDIHGEVVDSAFLGDDVVAWRLGPANGPQVCARSSDSYLARTACQLALRQGEGADVQLIMQVLHTLRAELREQPVPRQLPHTDQ